MLILYISWLYVSSPHPKLPDCRILTVDKSNNVSVQRRGTEFDHKVAELVSLVKLYVFCEKVTDKNGKAMLLTELRAWEKSMPPSKTLNLPLLEVARIIYHGTLQKNPARSFIVSLFADKVRLVSRNNQYPDDMPAEFHRDLVLEMLERMPTLTD